MANRTSCTCPYACRLVTHSSQWNLQLIWITFHNTLLTHQMWKLDQFVTSKTFIWIWVFDIPTAARINNSQGWRFTGGGVWGWNYATSLKFGICIVGCQLLTSWEVTIQR